MILPWSSPATGGAIIRYDPLFRGLPDEDTIPFDELCAFCAEHRTAVLAALPWLAAEIADARGFAAMLSMVRRLSGSRVHLSSDLRRCRARLGLELSAADHARVLRLLRDTTLVDVPSAWGVFLTLRRIAIAAAVSSEPDRRVVAHRFGVTERSLR